MTKYFDKTLDEILDILEELNEKIYKTQPEFYTGLTCEFNEWWAEIKFEDKALFNTENDSRLYLSEEIDDFEDLKDCIVRVLLEKFSKYQMVNFDE